MNAREAAKVMQEACAKLAEAKASEYITGKHDNVEVGRQAVALYQAIRELNIDEVLKNE